MPIPSLRPGATTQELSRAIEEIQAILRGRVELGHPQDPRDPTGTSLAGDGSVTQHNGTLVNVLGSWAQASVEAADTAVTFNHNLDLEPVSASVPNVTWGFCRFVHDGAAAAATSVLSLNYETGDTVGRDSIELRLYSDGVRTIDATHPVEVTLFFMPAVR